MPWVSNHHLPSPISLVIGSITAWSKILVFPPCPQSRPYSCPCPCRPPRIVIWEVREFLPVSNTATRTRLLAPSKFSSLEPRKKEPRLWPYRAVRHRENPRVHLLDPMSPRFLVPSCNNTVSKAQPSMLGVEVSGESIAADPPAPNPSKETTFTNKRATYIPHRAMDTSTSPAPHRTEESMKGDGACFQRLIF